MCEGMVSLKKMIGLVTVLLFVYNALFTYIIINLTAGFSRAVFLILLALDYMIIFYFILQVAHELRFSKAPVARRRVAKRRRRR